MKLFMLAFVLTGLAAASAEADPLDVFGQWRTDDGDAVIAISTCGEGAPCGTVVWINPQTVEINADRNNRDPALRERPLVGLEMLRDFSRDDAGWTSGSVYDPDSGRSYRAAIRRLNPSELEVKGCWGFICRTKIWTRVADAVRTGSMQATHLPHGRYSRSPNKRLRNSEASGCSGLASCKSFRSRRLARGSRL